MNLLLAACGRLLVSAQIVGRGQDERDRLVAEGRDLAERTGDRAALFVLELGLATSRMMIGWSSESPLVPGRRAVEIAQELNLEMQVTATTQLGNSYLHLGRLPDGLRATEEALELIGSDLEQRGGINGASAASFVLWQKGCLLMWMGLPGEAAACFDRSLEAGIEPNDERLVWLVNTWSGPALEELTGTSRQAIARSQQAVDVAEPWDSPFGRAIAWLYLGWAQLMHGHHAEALALLLDTDHLQRERGIAGVLWNLGQGLLAEAHLAAGDAESARTVANRCTADRDTWVFELRAHLSRSRVLRALDGASAQAEIEATLARAQQLLEMSGARAFAPFIVEERARLAAVLGDDERASYLLREARSLFGGVGAAGHVERIAKELEA
ncbi:MAG: hypothetical protein E4H11_07790 [Myxococcales bacterium]|nr:MAG: hypothetical protein E4H11_07790 [Myxococcales bacterium]